MGLRMPPDRRRPRGTDDGNQPHQSGRLNRGFFWGFRQAVLKVRQPMGLAKSDRRSSPSGTGALILTLQRRTQERAKTQRHVGDVKSYTRRVRIRAQRRRQSIPDLYAARGLLAYRSLRPSRAGRLCSDPVSRLRIIFDSRIY
jgi:hypothetical protein